MKLLELFCGTKSIGKEFAKLGFEVTSLDFEPRFNPDICADILTIPVDYFKGFDVIWASPPCNAFSVSVIGKNWNHDHTPKTERAEMGLAILNHTLDIIAAANPKFFFIENPMGKMRKIPRMTELHRKEVTYCQYGDNRMKPTDIWTNLVEWEPKPMCKRKGACHASAPRGSKTGTQGMANAEVKAIIPEELCREIANECFSRL
jgi:hypothetical protein